MYLRIDVITQRTDTCTGTSHLFLVTLRRYASFFTVS